MRESYMKPWRTPTMICPFLDTRLGSERIVADGELGKKMASVSEQPVTRAT
jgi:hypothetical protein